MYMRIDTQKNTYNTLRHI